MEINGYKYITEQEAINARKKCSDYYGLPKTPNSKTLYWVDYLEAYLDNSVFWYIIHDHSVEVSLGQPILFNVTVEEQIKK
jgi:hypothetical protein